MTEKVAIDRETVIKFVLREALEHGEMHNHLSDEVVTDDLEGCIVPSNVTRAYAEDDTLIVEGNCTVRERAGRIPASGGGRLEPPTNPPETIYEDVEIGFTAWFRLKEDLPAGVEVDYL